MSYNRHGDHNSSGSSSVYRDLRDKIACLSFRAFHRLVHLWLGAKGYRYIRPLGRWWRRGRRVIGGADYLAVSPGTDSMEIAIAVRDWATPVTRRSIDELQGFMTRHRISRGMIIGRNGFAPKARLTAADQFGRPIRLVSVAALAGSMAALGLGIRSEGSRCQVDHAFFDLLGVLWLGDEIAAPSKWRSFVSRRLKRSQSRSTPLMQRLARWLFWMLLAVVVIVVALQLSSEGIR